MSLRIDSPARLHASFIINEYQFGVTATEVQEVLGPQRLTKVPMAPSHIVGLINLRGQVVVALDMRGRLGLPIIDTNPNKVNVVLRTEAGPVAIMADKVGDVMNISDDEIRPVPVTFGPPMDKMLEGVCQRESGLLLILKVAEITAPLVL